ncbi:PaaX family transcriptional regulator [Paraburkholderia bannensis]|uniref:PaaX family transcriptional regulator n=1 Tax=Paraburkholderia bannensis TaxID=765414 RepID=UPI002ABE1563|nr:PaaX family transcriptional regulator [Paraburkholderia bannensis]
MKAPDLLLDMLLASGQPVTTHDLLRAGNLFGVRAIAIRVALSRLVADGKIRRNARGSYALAKREAGLLRAVMDWRTKHSLMQPWQGAWIAIQDSDVARSDKIAWRHHRLALDLWGFRQLRPGINVRPANLRYAVEELSQQLSEVGLSPKAFAFQIDALPSRIDEEARKLWRAEQIVEMNKSLLNRLSVSLKAIRSRPLDDEAVAESFLMGREVIACLVKDPLLPPELMPSTSRVRLYAAAQEYQEHGKLLWQRWLTIG